MAKSNLFCLSRRSDFSLNCLILPKRIIPLVQGVKMSWVFLRKYSMEKVFFPLKIWIVFPFFKCFNVLSRRNVFHAHSWSLLKSSASIYVLWICSEYLSTNDHLKKRVWLPFTVRRIENYCNISVYHCDAAYCYDDELIDTLHPLSRRGNEWHS